MTGYKAGDEVRVFADRRHPNVEGGYPGGHEGWPQVHGTAEYEVPRLRTARQSGDRQRTIEFSLDDATSAAAQVLTPRPSARLPRC